MSETMIERVAKAMCRHALPELDPDAKQVCGPANERGRPAWRYFEERARIAIGAMREPTLDMVLAGCRRAREGRELADEYTAMIDEALKTSP